MEEEAAQNVDMTARLEARILERVGPVFPGQEHDQCCLCLAPIENGSVTAGIFSVSHPNGLPSADIWWGTVCRDCVAAGAAGAAQRMEAVARDILQNAKEIAAIAPEQWDSVEELDGRAAARRAKDAAQKSAEELGVQLG